MRNLVKSHRKLRRAQRLLLAAQKDLGGFRVTIHYDGSVSIDRNWSDEFSNAKTLAGAYAKWLKLNGAKYAKEAAGKGGEE